MGSWVRGGEPPDEIKVTFVVNSRKDPELAAWLWGLPYRGTSASVRDILSAAARRLGQQASATVTSEAQQAAPAKAATVQTSTNTPLPTPVAREPSSEAKDVQVISDADGHEGMTAAVANLMREMDSEF